MSIIDPNYSFIKVYSLASKLPALYYQLGFWGKRFEFFCISEEGTGHR